MKQAETLTKDQLKEELLAHGVELPSAKALKSVYIDLYNTHINKKTLNLNNSIQQKSNKKAAKKTTNLSTLTETLQEKERKVSVLNTKVEKDEVQGVVKPVLVRKGRGKENDKVKVVELHCVLSVEQDKGEKEEAQSQEDIEDLSNAEIAARLRSLGQSCGPVGATTRKVYLKKLAKLLQSGDALENHDAASEEEPVDVPPVTRSASKRRSMMAAPMQPVVSVRKSLNSSRQQKNSTTVTDDIVEEKKPVPEIHYVTETDGPAAETIEKSKPSKPERRWIPIWLQIAFTILVVLLAYLVFQALEKNPRPLSLPKGGSKD